MKPSHWKALSAARLTFAFSGVRFLSGMTDISDETALLTSLDKAAAELDAGEGVSLEGVREKIRRRRPDGRQGSSSSPRRRSWLRPCRRWGSGQLLAAAARNASLLPGS